MFQKHQNVADSGHDIVARATTTHCSELYHYDDTCVKVTVILTDGQSASLSWCQATITAHNQFYFLLEIVF
jgi:hypothetical protein